MEVCSHNRLDPRTVLLKINGTECNLNCKYCSEVKKTITQKMSTDYFCKVIDGLPNDCDVILHGGEPLINSQMIEQIIDLFRARSNNRKLSIQTNGVLSEGMLKLLLKNREYIRIGISIDGSHAQNKLRVDKAGHPAFERTVYTMRFLEQHKVNIKCIATINAVNAEFPNDILNFFLSFQNVKQLRINPCFDVQNGKLAEYAVMPLQFLSFLLFVTRRWVQDSLYRRLRLDPIQAEIETRAQRTVGCYQPSCSRFISVYSNGYCTSCDALGAEGFFVEDYADVFEKSVNYINVSEITACFSCQELHKCGGGCPAIFKRFSQSQELVAQYCNYRREFSKAIYDLCEQIKH